MDSCNDGAEGDGTCVCNARYKGSKCLHCNYDTTSKDGWSGSNCDHLCKNGDWNASLEKAGGVADFLELGELFARDALERNESCGGHFREEYQTEEGEAVRDDANYTYAAAWEYTGEPSEAILHKEALKYENIELKTRSYK